MPPYPVRYREKRAFYWAFLLFLKIKKDFSADVSN